MFKWFGLESNANQATESPVATSNEKDKSSQSTEEQASDGEKSRNESADKIEQPQSSANEHDNKSYAMGAFGLLSNFASAATKTAHKLKESVDQKLDKSIIGDFQRENEKFVKEKHAKRAEDPVPPWVGYNEETEMKSQILALSTDERHFLRDPPTGVDFYFDLDTMMPVALTILAEDENLQKMRFNLVPKKVKEERFWRNYFYRVSLIKQSSQLSTLAQSETKRNSNGQDSNRNSRSDLEKLSSENNKENSSQSSTQNDNNPSDTGQAKFGSNDASATDKNDVDTTDWEKDLQDELQDFEFVSEDQGDNQEPNPEWEKEIENMLGLDEDDGELK